MDVCVTGYGAYCPLAADVPATFASLLEGRSAVSARARNDSLGLGPVAVAACPRDVEVPGIAPHLLRGVDRVSLMSLVSAMQALEQAEQGAPLARENVAVVWGTSMGGLSTLDGAYEDLLVRQKRRVRPTTIPYIMPSVAAYHLAHHLGVRGLSLSLTVACASSALAIIQGVELLRSGRAQAVLVGGCESMLQDVPLRGWQMTQALALADEDEPHKSCRPFSASRKGFAMGEGAACLLLESGEHAQQRGARVLGWVRGYGQTTDALNVLRPDAPAQARAMAQALEASAVKPQEVAYLNAHGTATDVGDASEATAIQTVWGELAKDVAVSSTKSQHGHLIGAAGALEAIVALESLHHGRCPGNVHSPDIDEAFRGLYLPLEACELPAHKPFAMSNSFAFGGVNVSLVLQANREG